MLNNKKALLIILIALALSGCDNQGQRQVYLVSAEQSMSQANYNIVECVIGDIDKISSSQATVEFSYEDIYMESDTVGAVKEIYAYNKMDVKKGDVLAYIEFDYAQLNTEAEKAKINIENLEKLLENEKAARQEQIVALSIEMRGMSPQEAGIQQLKIEREKYELEYSVYNSQKKIDKLKSELKEIEKKLNGVQITAPFDGFVSNIAYFSSGELIDNNTRLMSIYKTDDFRLQINAEIGAFRYNSEVIIEIQNHEKTYTGRIVTNPLAVKAQWQARYTVIFDEPPENFYSLSNRRIIVRGSSYELLDVPLLSSKAVLNEGSSKYVFILEDNVVKKRYVQIGLNNYSIVQILSGVNPGDLVLE